MYQIWKESALEMKKAYVSLTANSLKLNILLVTTLGANPTQVDPILDTEGPSNRVQIGFNQVY